MSYEPSPELLRYYAGNDPDERELARAYLMANYSEWQQVYPDLAGPAERCGNAIGAAFLIGLSGLAWFGIGLLVGMLVWR